MWKNFVRIFEEEIEVENVVWVMDYSFNVRDHPDVAVRMWPDDNKVSWLFFNIFQRRKIGNEDGRGDCPGGLDKIYRNFMDNLDRVPEWETIPWGLGAWGSAKASLPIEDR